MSWCMRVWETYYSTPILCANIPYFRRPSNIWWYSFSSHFNAHTPPISSLHTCNSCICCTWLRGCGILNISMYKTFLSGEKTESMLSENNAHKLYMISFRCSYMWMWETLNVSFKYQQKPKLIIMQLITDIHNKYGGLHYTIITKPQRVLGCTHRVFCWEICNKVGIQYRHVKPHIDYFFAFCGDAITIKLAMRCIVPLWGLLPKLVCRQ